MTKSRVNENPKLKKTTCIGNATNATISGQATDNSSFATFVTGKGKENSKIKSFMLFLPHS